MGRIGSLLRDRRRAQRGSVLSGVLIITAFLAIISGALMSTLSTNFLLSRDLMKRVSSEATVKSSVDLAIDSVQNAPFTTACPALNSVPTLNGMNASVTYISCALVTDNVPAASPIANSAPFTVDGSYVSLPGVLPGPGNEYLVADSGGTLFAYPFGGATASWSYALPGTPTAPPMAMSAGNGDIADLVPISYGDAAGGAVALVAETTPGQQPSLKCTLAPSLGSMVSATPAAGRDAQNVVFFGDQNGRLYAFDASASGSCSLLRSISVGTGQPIVAGPLVFPQSGSRDRLFFVVSDGASSTLVQYRYSGNSPSFSHITPDVTLPAPNAVGMTADGTTLPARLAITFSGGQVALVQVSTSFAMTLTQSASVPAGVSSPPGWCPGCAGGSAIIGVGGSSGLYLLDSNLNLYSSFTGAGITTTPAADAGGDWFAGGANGTILELRVAAGGMAVAHLFSVGPAGIGSSPVVNACPAAQTITFTHLCVYFGATNSHAYLIPLDARDAVLSACIAAQGSCTTGNPRLWTHVVVGVASNPQAVHVLGFSYYSA